MKKTIVLTASLSAIVFAVGFSISNMLFAKMFAGGPLNFEGEARVVKALEAPRHSTNVNNLEIVIRTASGSVVNTQACPSGTNSRIAVFPPLNEPNVLRVPAINAYAIRESDNRFRVKAESVNEDNTKIALEKGIHIQVLTYCQTAQNQISAIELIQ